MRCTKKLGVTNKVYQKNDTVRKYWYTTEVEVDNTVFGTVVRSYRQEKIMHVGRRVGTVFGVGARVVRADVQRRTVHVIAQDGEEYGPVAIQKLKAPRCEETHVKLLEAWVTHRAEDYAARRITEAIRRTERQEVPTQVPTRRRVPPVIYHEGISKI